MKFSGWLLLGFAMLFCVCGNLSRNAKTQMNNQSTQKIIPLAEEDKKRLQDQRAVVEKYPGDDVSRQKYQTTAGKLGLIRGILEAQLFKPNQTYELQRLGIVLGDAFVQELKMEWVIVEDRVAATPLCACLARASSCMR